MPQGLYLCFKHHASSIRRLPCTAKKKTHLFGKHIKKKTEIMLAANCLYMNRNGLI